MRSRGLAIVVLFVSAAGMPASAEIQVTNSGGAYRLGAYANGANGNAGPLRVLEGNVTHLIQPGQVFADVLHGHLYVANQFENSIGVYPLGASGNQPPLRLIVGAATLMDRPTGVVVDLVNDEIIVSNFDDGDDGFITVYPRTSNGNTPPLRRIIGAATGLEWAVQIALDPVANEIFVATQGNNVPAGIRVFSRTANGNAAPLRTISGPNTQIDTPYGIAFDAAHNEILLSDREGAISTFARTANGNVAPLRRIAGANSTLLETLGLTLLGNSEIVAANNGPQGGNNYSDDAVLVFNRTANGNVAPKRKINGANTLLSGPTGVGVVSPRLGLRNDRFGVQAVFRTEAGVVGDGTPVQLTPDTGYLWFFQSSNVEIVVKILNGCGINNRYWVFAGGLTDVNVDLIVTDYATGRIRTYNNPQKTAFQPIQDTSAFATCNVATAIHRDDAEAELLEPEPLQVEMLDARAREVEKLERSVQGPLLLLNNDRFEVRAEWETTATSGLGTPVAITGDTGYFWFFNSENVEAVIKVLNACAINNRYWVFAGGLTDVAVRLTVTDKLRGNVKIYENPQKTPFQPIQDTSAFATCP